MTAEPVCEVSCDIPRNLIRISFRRHVSAADTKIFFEKAAGVLSQIRKGFTMLTDLSGLDAMDLDCVPDLTRMMDAPHYREHRYSPGTISVSAGNPCGSSAVYTRTVTTSSGPGAATDITGPSAPCSGTSVTLTTPNVPTASSYQWSVTGSGWSGSSSSNTINVTAGSGNGVISVYPINACGSGTAYTTTITAAPSPSSTFALSSHITPANSSIIAF